MNSQKINSVHRRSRAFTLVELLVVVAIIALLISLLLPALGKAFKSGRSLKDSTQIRQIHTAMLNFAQNSKGRFPTPGLINRKPFDMTGGGGAPIDTPNQGKEDVIKNRTNFFYSCMIAQEFYPPVLVIGPTEVNPIVTEDKIYNYDAYNPGADTYWDGDVAGTGAVNPDGFGTTTGTFSAKINLISTSPNRCNASYAHMAIIGSRKKDKWKDSGSAVDPVIGTRGPGAGGTSGSGSGIMVVKPGQADYDKSPTLRLHDPPRQWDGNVAFNDNHCERLDSFYPSLTNYEFGQDPLTKDNIFVAEFGTTTGIAHQQGDAFLVMCSAYVPNLPSPEGQPADTVACMFDRLDP